MYRKNTSGQYIYFALINASTGAALTGATVAAYRALDGNAQASATGTTTELANGQYRFALSQADTNADYGSYLFTATGAVPVEKTVVFTGANPTDAVRFGLTALPNAAAAASGGLHILGNNAAKPVYQAGIEIQQSTTNGSGLSITGNGSGAAVLLTGGSTGEAIKAIADAASVVLIGASTTGHGIEINAHGSNKHGIQVAGGTGGTSDGIKAVAGTGGVSIRGAVDANLVTIAGSTVAVDTGGSGIVSFISNAYVMTAGGTVNANVTQIAGENVVNDGNGKLIAGFDAASLAQFFTVDTTKVYADAVAGSVVFEIAENAVGAGGLDAAGVRAAVGLASANLDTQLGAIDDYIDTEVAAIKAKTDNLPSDPADQSLIIAATDAIKTVADAIKAKTDNLPSDPADQSLVMGAIAALPTATDVADAVKAATVDGITIESLLEAMLAVVAGKATVSGSTVSFKLRDGTTTKVAITYGGTPGQRTGSTLS